MHVYLSQILKTERGISIRLELLSQCHCETIVPDIYNAKFVFVIAISTSLQ